MHALTQTTRNMALLLGSSLAVLPAIAGAPIALDFVPTDSDAVVVVPNFGEFLSDVNAVNALLGDDGQPMLYMMTAMVRGMPGIDLDGSAAGVLEFIHDAPNADEDMGEDFEDGNGFSAKGVVLVPVTDFAKFSNGHRFNNGLFEMPMGEDTFFFRRVSDGYAVIGDDADRVRSFDGTDGQLEANATMIGTSGNRIIAGNDLMVYFNFDAFADEIAQGQEEMENQGEMVRMMGGDDAAEGFDAFIEAVETMANDGSVFAVGVNFDLETGVSIDAGLQFTQGSTSASYLQNNGDAGKYFANVPNMDYFFATAFDFSGSGVQSLMNDYFDMATDLAGEQAIGLDLKALMSGVNGGVQVMGASDNIMGGLFTNTLYYIDADEPSEYIGAVRKAFEQADASEQLFASVDGESLEINGTDAFGYSVGVDMSGLDELAGGFGGPSPSMIMGMVFGADGGPSGYLANTGGGVVSTFSKDAQFFSAAVDAANGNNTLSTVSVLAQSSALLPDNRIFEGYLGADHLINTAGPMLMMFGILPEFEPVEPLAPIGMGVTADGGGVMLRAVFPMKTIQTIQGMIPEGIGEFADGDESVDF